MEMVNEECAEVHDVHSERPPARCCGRSSYPSLPVSVVAGEGGGSTMRELTRARKSAGQGEQVRQGFRSLQKKRGILTLVTRCRLASAMASPSRINREEVRILENQLEQRQLCHQMFPVDGTPGSDVFTVTNREQL